MKYNGKFSKPDRAKKKNSKLIVILSSVAGVLVVFNILLLLFIPRDTDKPAEPSETTVPETTLPPVTETEPTEGTTVPEETEPMMLGYMEELYLENPDVVGWIKIEGTELDDPVMHTPEDEEKYIRADFEGNFDVAGLPFIAAKCSLDPESDNLIIYGHNMLNGTMFRPIMNYSSEQYWKDHPIIEFTTLYEERQYEIVAAFYDRVYYNYEDVFKFYQFIDAEDEEDFNEAIAYYKENAEYETGVTAEYGDHLLTLVTCSYHHQYGRFVVVARQITEQPEDLA